MKTCKLCKVEKEYSHFRLQVRNDKNYYNGTCKSCDYELGKVRHSKFREFNRNKISQVNALYYVENKNEIKNRRNVRERNKRATSPAFRIKQIVSSHVRAAIKKAGGSKNNLAVCKFFNFSLNDLLFHIENQFEPWMNWSNYGVFNSKSWNDNDVTSWTWNIDHIIPQSDLPYFSMIDDNFKRCWALENLRPLSAKQNFSDGVLRIRHGAI